MKQAKILFNINELDKENKYYKHLTKCVKYADEQDMHLNSLVEWAGNPYAGEINITYNICKHCGIGMYYNKQNEIVSPTLKKVL